jgi:hypothetical protein
VADPFTGRLTSEGGIMSTQTLGHTVQCRLLNSLHGLLLPDSGFQLTKFTACHFTATIA